MAIKDVWEKWNEERQVFQARDTEGFSKDLAALEAHIKRLTATSPKDEAGWPTRKALAVIDELTKQYNGFKRYIDLAKP